MRCPPIIRLAAFPLCLGALALPGCGGGDHGGTTKPKTTAVGVKAAGVIAFRRYSDPSQAQGSIFTISPDGTGERRLTQAPSATVDDMPAISADGRRVAFERCPKDAPCHVYVVNTNGGQLRRVAIRCPLGPVCDASGPAWSADGRLAVNLASGRVKPVGQSGDQIQRSDIEVVDLKRGTQRSVAHVAKFEGDLVRPVWSPDGRRIAYQLIWSALSTSHTGTAIHVVSADGGRPQRITPYSIAAGDGPDWSPDGQWIVFRTHSDTEDRPTDLAVVHPDGTGFHELTHFHSAQHLVLSSSYSPDGKWIAYGSRLRGGPADVFIMRSDGTGSRPLTRTKAWDSAPEWGSG